MLIPEPGSQPWPNDNSDDDQPPVPPDQQPDVIPVEEPPKPGRDRDEPPMRVRSLS